MDSTPPTSPNPDQPNYEIDIEQTWICLKNGLDHMYSEVFQNMPREKYIELYTHVYNYCSKEGLYRAKLRRNNESNIKCFGQELYDKLGDYLSSYLSCILENQAHLAGENLLIVFNKLWEKYQFSSKVLNGICSYLNRNWVLKVIEDGRSGVYMVYHLAVVLWRDNFFLPLNAAVTSAILKIIEKDRMGENINYGLVNRIVNCYIEYGITEDDPLGRKESLVVYQKFFEEAFLHDTESYYIKESARFLRQNTVAEYMKKVEMTLSNEEKRVRLYLHDTTLGALSRICEQVLIAKHVEQLYSEFQNLLDADKYEDLGRMYSLVSLIPGGLKELRNLFESHVYSQGLCALEICGHAALNDPSLYVQTILNVHRKYNCLLSTAFANEIGFSAGLDKACEKFINSNAVTRLANSCNRSPHLLAQYCDSILRKSPMSPEESGLEEALNRIMTVFKYIRDKDVFQKFYGKFLGNRLIQGTSFSEHGEACMLYKLRELCGFDYTYRLQRLFQDIDLSKSVNERFENYLANSDTFLNLDYNVKVLSEGFWQNFEDTYSFALPPELQDAVGIFTGFYRTLHNGRKLRWLCNKSKGEIITNCFKNRYILQASTFQISILLQYNDAESLLVSQLQQAIQVEEKPLLRCLKGLINSKLLFTKDKEELNLDSVVSLFLGYKNRKLRVSINIPIKSEAKIEQEATYKTVEVERGFLIQATIVRIMKMRKVLKHQHLISEVLSQLSPKFKPTVQHIKKCINVLIEKEYLKRMEDDKEAYQYLA